MQGPAASSSKSEYIVIETKQTTLTSTKTTPLLIQSLLLNHRPLTEPVGVENFNSRRNYSRSELIYNCVSVTCLQVLEYFKKSI